MAFTPEQNELIKGAYANFKTNNDAAGLMKQMTDYGVDVNAIANATGYSANEIGNWLSSNGAPAGFGGYTAPANLYEGWNQHFGTNLGADGKDQTPPSYTAPTNPNGGTVIGGGVTDSSGVYHMQSPQGEAASLKAYQDYQAKQATPTKYAQTQQYNSPTSYMPTTAANQNTNSNPTQAPFNPYLSQQNSGSSQQYAWGQSPWVKQTADALTAQSNQNLQQNVMPGIRSGAVSAGQYGSSRQGVMEGIAAGNAQTGLNSALANLYSNAYGQDQSASLQNKSLDNSYNLGLGNLSLTNQGQMQNFYTNQRGQDLQSAQIGGQLYGQGNQGNLGIGQGQYNIGQTTQNAPANAISQYNSLISPYTGYGQSTTQTGQSGGGAQGVIGGALAGGQIASNLGFGNTSNPYANYTGDYNSLAYRP